MARRASPSTVDQRRTFSTWPSMDMRYPMTPCSPGGMPLTMEVSAVEVVDGATHLFEEPGTLAEAAALARDWFLRHLSPAGEHGDGTSR